MSTPSTKEPPFKLVHVFDAPRELVFNAFSTAEALAQWWGPAETTNSVVSLDFRPGGVFHFKMEYNGIINYGRFLFGTIRPYDVLEFSNAFADEKGNVIPAPFDIPLPKEILYRLYFTEHAGKTTLTITGEPINATPEEKAGLLQINEDMQRGFTATWEKLEGYLAS